jgi:uncharacterized protein YycO
MLLHTHARSQDYASQLREGDLLFQDLDCGPMCDAIEQVTTSYKGYHFSHIGLVHIQNDSVYVIEAIGNRVQLTPLDVFSARTENEMLTGRVKPLFRYLVSGAVNFALSKLDVPYDDAFLYDNGKYYCSELIYDAFKHANQGHDFFVLEPMTFKKPGSNEFYPVWINYYHKLGMPIPEGLPGINPGGISRSEKLDILRP